MYTATTEAEAGAAAGDFSPDGDGNVSGRKLKLTTNIPWPTKDFLQELIQNLILDSIAMWT